MYIFSAILITFPLHPLAKGLCLLAKIVAFFSGADNALEVAFHLCTFGALFLHFYFTINTPEHNKRNSYESSNIGISTPKKINIIAGLVIIAALAVYLVFDFMSA